MLTPLAPPSKDRFSHQARKPLSALRAGRQGRRTGVKDEKRAKGVKGVQTRLRRAGTVDQREPSVSQQVLVVFVRHQNFVRMQAGDRLEAAFSDGFAQLCDR